MSAHIAARRILCNAMIWRYNELGNKHPGGAYSIMQSIIDLRGKRAIALPLWARVDSRLFYSPQPAVEAHTALRQISVPSPQVHSSTEAIQFLTCSMDMTFYLCQGFCITCPILAILTTVRMHHCTFLILQGYHLGTIAAQKAVKRNITPGLCLCMYCIACTEKDDNDMGLFSHCSMRVSGRSSLNCLECCRSTVACFSYLECELSTVNMAFEINCTCLTIFVLFD